MNLQMGAHERKKQWLYADMVWVYLFPYREESLESNTKLF